MFSLPCVNIQTSEYEPRSRVTDKYICGAQGWRVAGPGAMRHIFITTTGSSQQRCRLYCTDITQNKDEDVITLHIHDHKLFVDTVFDKAEAAERIFPLSTIAGRPEMTYGHPVPCDYCLNCLTLEPHVHDAWLQESVCISTANIYTGHGHQPPPAPAKTQNPVENTCMCRNKEAGISSCQKRMWLVMAKILTYNSQHCSSFLSYIC